MSDKTNYTALDVVSGTATSTAGAATINAQTGLITTEALSTAAGANYTMTLTNSLIKAGSIVHVTVGKGTSTNGIMTLATVTVSATSAVMVFQNIHASAAVNGTFTIGFTVFNFN